MIAAVSAAMLATFVFLGLGASAAFAGTAALRVSEADDPAAQPTLAQTGYDFTPMLITAAVVLLIAGITVIIAKYALTRSSHS
ncbi:hypothetical protein [Herbiconiux daphne]|uniref:Uncharacterized protein n=1 Tax=Herbiconiux daphne TaxID=2970914 RepID=A0ABT2H2F9_9MICO|nr:hypothetical protein [Herbiconiux daphne]MCS5734138.1 hypothetical protein [Herbiconiux daphne]